MNLSRRTLLASGAVAAAVAVGPFFLRVRGQSGQVGWIREPGSGVAKQVAVKREDRIRMVSMAPEKKE